MAPANGGMTEGGKKSLTMSYSLNRLLCILFVIPATTGILTKSMQRTRIPGHHPQPSQLPWHSTLHFGRSTSRDALLSWSTQQPATTQHCTTPTHWSITEDSSDSP
ncbi:unnamed protein product [Euphydryas editha]|uniref:Uncharacterized protein n=1 Tax=Euphydryas editha TaxID=104508 RepID=A0AAU9UN58_EUPED|nr:unnamed protein product [Euphydryas editha]